MIYNLLNKYHTRYDFICFLIIISQAGFPFCRSGNCLNRKLSKKVDRIILAASRLNPFVAPFHFIPQQQTLSTLSPDLTRSRAPGLPVQCQRRPVRAVRIRTRHPAVTRPLSQQGMLPVSICCRSGGNGATLCGYHNISWSGLS